jgi:N-acetylmuramoyl-L-alanine amidase
MRRYLLYDYSCNIEKFYKLNKIDAKTQLKKGKKYLLPILIVKYNGKSIRSSLKTEDLKQALRIQQFNDEAKASSLRSDDFRVSKLLWIPYHEFRCPPEGEAEDAEVLFQNEASIQGPKPALGNRIFPVFGEKYQKTPLLSTKLKGKVYYIVSGHGGKDTGAIGKRQSKKLAEDEYAYDVALRLVRHLVGHGATAYMIVRDPDDGIRDTEYLEIDYDELLWGNATVSDSQKERLQDRCDIINNIYADYLSKGIKDQIFIEIHVDSRSRKQREKNLQTRYRTLFYLDMLKCVHKGAFKAL